MHAHAMTTPQHVPYIGEEKNVNNVVSYLVELVRALEVDDFYSEREKRDIVALVSVFLFCYITARSLSIEARRGLFMSDKSVPPP